jgi:hypothetical protein
MENAFEHLCTPFCYLALVMHSEDESISSGGETLFMPIRCNLRPISVAAVNYALISICQ